MINYDWIKPDQIVTFALIFFRVGGVFLMAPIFNNKSVPNRVKLMLILMTTFLLLPLVGVSKAPVVEDHFSLLVMVLKEVSIGVMIGFLASMVFAGIQAAGELFGLQMGFSIATIIDPANEGAAGVITTFYTILGALLFLYLNGHHLILTALTKSFQLLPLAQGFDVMAGHTLAQFLSKLFSIAIQIAAPIIVVLTILSVIMGVINKLSPSLNIYFNLGFIIGPVVGFVILLATLPLFRVLITNLTEEMGHDMIRLVREMKGV